MDHELAITVQTSLTFSVDGKSVTVPTFVQPESEQGCLLGMNIIPQLGIRPVHENKEPILVICNSDPDVAEVCLVGAVAIPGRRGKILTGTLMKTRDLAFVPNSESLGENAQESLVTASEDG